MTATLLLSALATKSVLPSGATASGVGRAPLGCRGKESRVDRLGDDPPARVDHRHAVARRAGDEDPVVAGMNGDLVGMLADGDPGDRAEVVRVEHAHRCVRPSRRHTGACRCVPSTTSYGRDPAGADFSSLRSSRSSAEIVPPSMSSE